MLSDFPSFEKILVESDFPQSVLVFDFICGPDEISNLFSSGKPSHSFIFQNTSCPDFNRFQGVGFRRIVERVPCVRFRIRSAKTCCRIFSRFNSDLTNAAISAVSNLQPGKKIQIFKFYAYNEDSRLLCK